VAKIRGFPLTLIVALTTVLRTTLLHCDESGDTLQFVCDAVLPSARSGDLINIHRSKCCRVIGCNAATECIILYMDIIMHNSSKTVAAVLCFMFYVLLQT